MLKWCENIKQQSKTVKTFSNQCWSSHKKILSIKHALIFLQPEIFLKACVCRKNFKGTKKSGNMLNILSSSFCHPIYIQTTFRLHFFIILHTYMGINNSLNQTQKSLFLHTEDFFSVFPFSSHSSQKKQAAKHSTQNDVNMRNENGDVRNMHIQKMLKIKRIL